MRYLTTTRNQPEPTFMGLPMEIRLQIYDIALLTSTDITIGSAELTGTAPEIVHRLYGEGREPFPGIKLNHEPVIAAGYDRSLLNIAQPGQIPAASASDSGTCDACAALSLVNKTIHMELRSHLHTKPRGRNVSLFVSYPSGLHILFTQVPTLLRQARSIHLAGVYCGAKSSYNESHRAHLPLSKPGDAEKAYINRLIPDSAAQLSDLLKSLFGPSARHNIERLDLRIYYPGPDSYSTVWSAEQSPVFIALMQIPNADFGITLHRGAKGTGVHMTIQASESRVVRTVWRPLQEGGTGEEKIGSWVVDPSWPKWEDGEELEEGTVLPSRA